MNEITIKTQKALDSLIKKRLTEPTYIRLDGKTFEISKNTENGIYLACGSSQVTACGSSQVTACDSSQVTAYDSSQVTACGSSQVTAYDSSQVRACGSSITVHALLHNAILINQTGEDIRINRLHPSAQVIAQPIWLHTKASFLDIYPADENGFVTLYKVTKADGCDHHTGKIKYEGIVECPDWVDNPDQQCGNGLHLSPLPELALGYHQGPVKKCRVHIDDFSVYPRDITKVRCRRVEVIGVVDK